MACNRRLSEVIRCHHGEVCRILDTVEGSLLLVAGRLFEKCIIDMKTKNEVFRQKGYEGANTMMDYVLMKIEQNPQLFLLVVDVLGELDILEAVVKEMKRKDLESSNETNDGMENIPELLIPVVERVSDVNSLEPFVEGLQDKFEELLVSVTNAIEGVDVKNLRTRINWFLNCERQNTSAIEDHLAKLESFEKPEGILNYLVRSDFIGWLNYELIKVLQKVAKSKQVDDEIKQYEESHLHFLQVKFIAVLQLFQRRPDLAPTFPVGLPKLEIHLDTPWQDRIIFEWKECLQKRFSWPPNLIIRSISQKCVILTCAVLPFFVASIIRDLNDPDVLNELESEGVRMRFLFDFGSQKVVSPMPDESSEILMSLSKEHSDSKEKSVVLRSMSYPGSLDDLYSEPKFGNTVEETYSEGKQLAQKRLRKLQWMTSSLSTHIEEMEAQIKLLTGEKEYDFVTLSQSLHDVGSTRFLTLDEPIKLTSELPTCQVPRSSQQSYPVYSFVPMNFPTDTDSDPGISLDDEPMLRTAAMEHKLQLVEEKYSADKEIAKKRQLSLHKLQQMTSSLYSQVKDMETVIDIETGEEEFVSVSQTFEETHFLTLDEQRKLDEALIGAVDRNNISDVQKLLEHKANPNYRNVNEDSSLYHAIMKKNTEILNLLISYGGDIHIRDWFGRTLLHFASENGNADIVNVLISHGGDIHAVDWYNRTLLHFASEGGNADIVDLLISHGEDINAVDKRNRTALHLASEEGNADIVTLLISHGGDIHVVDEEGRTPFNIGRGNKVVEALKRQHSKDKALIEALSKNNHEDIEILIKEGANINFQNLNQALYGAVEMNCGNAIEGLLNNGASPNFCDYKKMTPLHLASKRGQNNIAALLLSHGGDVHQQDSDGRTPLHWASESGHSNIVYLLLSYRGNVNVKDKNHDSPLCLACKSDNADTVNILLSYDADVNAKGDFQRTPLHWASRWGNTDTVNALLSRGGDIHAKDGMSESPLDLARNYYRQGIVEILEACSKL